MIRQTNLSFVRREREEMVFTVFAHLDSRTARPGRIGAARDGEMEVVRFRRPDGLENWAYVTAAADKLTLAAREGEAA